jgi:uncharacterized protein (TIGR00369 family)
MSTSVRTRTVTWEDPAVFAEAATRLSGKELLQAVLDGTLPVPPIGQLIGLQLVEIGDGRVVFTFVPAEYHYSPLGIVHGGIAATLLDTAMGCAIQTLLPVGTGLTTLDLAVTYVRPLTIPTGEVRAEGTVIHRGGQIATAKGQITDANDKLYAHATTTCLLLQR